MTGLVKPRTSAPSDPWLTFWAKRPLPILQSTKAALAQFSGRAETARANEITAIVLRDPLLTAHALRFINQRPSASLASEVVSIDNVIMLMGINAFIGFSKLPAVEQLLLPKHAPHYYQLLNEIVQARLAAKLAREFATLRYDARLDEIHVTALLARLPYMLRTIEPGLPEAAPRTDLEQVGVKLFEAWKLPESFSILLGESGATQRALLEQTAIRLATRLHTGWWDELVEDDLRILAATLGIEPPEVWRIVSGTMLKMAAKDWPYPQVPPPARWLPMIPGPWPKPKVAAAQAAPRQTLQDIMLQLVQAGESGASFNQIMSIAIKAIAVGIGIKRIVFAILMAGHNCLKTRYLHGAPNQDPLHELQIDLTAPHIVTKLMLKPQSIWLNASNHAQYESMLPRGLRQTIGPHEFFAMSLFVEDKPVGIFYADNLGSPALSEAQYHAFKQVCLVTGKCLTQQARRVER
ncbi:HDOD domain-containing protein [Parachitinimonas caeni]|uniref:HDOD domain-containing protein n=1 Tax=Parachitinimonas caeni TaxID=3031301 RepID=A0ABT7DX39_9NEIS|nr:hypothetical protein [Parachitinimonas caeni]MDK2124633.1 hypothetical protein [Parachitinimonas caeni]